MFIHVQISCLEIKNSSYYKDALSNHFDGDVPFASDNSAKKGVLS